jgi:uracil-DNA glycosylase family 4
MTGSINHNNSVDIPGSWYDGNCRRCDRLAGFLDAVKIEHPGYFCKPVPPFGDHSAELLVVGLAPGKHGANATGRPFTGDYAGVLLYQTLYKFGFASKPVSEHVDDGLVLHNCRITNAVKCLPPQNKPVGDEEKNCNRFLSSELSGPDVKVILALGLLAHRSILRSFAMKLSSRKFGHNRVHALEDGVSLVNSYHCSRYNTQTRRLTESMFEDVFRTVQAELAHG